MCENRVITASYRVKALAEFRTLFILYHESGERSLMNRFDFQLSKGGSLTFYA